MAHSNHGIAKDDKGQEQPVDKQRAQTAHTTNPGKSGSREATRDPKLTDRDKTPGSGMVPDDRGDPPTGGTRCCPAAIAALRQERWSRQAVGHREIIGIKGHPRWQATTTRSEI